MKKFIYTGVFIGLLCVGGGVAYADNPGQGPYTAPTEASLNYVPLEPIPGFNDNLTNASFPDLLKAIFKILFSLAALLSVVMFVVGGVEYMVSDVVALKTKAKERLWNTLWGMLILAGSWLILYTVNPNLLDFSFSLSSTPRTNIITPQSSTGNATTGLSTGPCKTPKSSSGMSLDGTPEITVVPSYAVFSSSSGCGNTLASLGLQNIKQGLVFAGASVLVVENDYVVKETNTVINPFQSSCQSSGGKIKIGRPSSITATVYVCRKL